MGPAGPEWAVLGMLGVPGSPWSSLHSHLVLQLFPPFKVRQRCHRVAWRSKFAVPDPGGLIWPDVMRSAHVYGAQRAGGEDLLFSLLFLLFLPPGGGHSVLGAEHKIRWNFSLFVLPTASLSSFSPDSFKALMLRAHNAAPVNASSRTAARNNSQYLPQHCFKVHSNGTSGSFIHNNNKALFCSYIPLFIFTTQSSIN